MKMTVTDRRPCKMRRGDLRRVPQNPGVAVIAYHVGQRTQEIGLRMALGATEGKVLSLIVGQAMRPVLVGLAVGVAGAVALTRVMAGILFEVSATDPATFAAVVLVLGAAALLASWAPARRASQVDPSRALAP